MKRTTDNHTENFQKYWKGYLKTLKIHENHEKLIQKKYTLKITLEMNPVCY